MIVPEIEALLGDREVTDICINGCQNVFFDRGRGLEAVQKKPIFTEHTLREWILERLSQAGKTWDAKHPFVDATLESGHRLHVAFPPLAQQGILISLRRLPKRFSQEDRLTPGGSSRWRHATSGTYYSRLVEAVKQGDSILISGATGSGKTTLATDLLGEVPVDERIIALEDTQELAPNHPHFVSLMSRPPNADGFGEVSLRTLLKQTLRMRPDRIILGECRGPEVLELLQSLNTGHRGAMATLHANSPREALRRIELLCLLASAGSVPAQSIRELLSLGIQWIAQVDRTQVRAEAGAQMKGERSIRRIRELWKIEGREGDTILMRQVLD